MSARTVHIDIGEVVAGDTIYAEGWSVVESIQMAKDGNAAAKNGVTVGSAGYVVITAGRRGCYFYESNVQLAVRLGPGEYASGDVA